MLILNFVAASADHKREHNEKDYLATLIASCEDLKPLAEPHVDYELEHFWFGGRTSLTGVENNKTTILFRPALASERQSQSRVSKHQSLKDSYSDGAYVRFGGNYQNVSVAWQYGWLGKPN